MDERPVGVFDSGVGGLTVMKEIVRLLPAENVVYFGDTARTPYGDRPPEVVTQYALEIASFMIKRQVKAIAIACNTMSALCLNLLLEACPMPVIEMIGPCVLAAMETGKRGVCLMATNGTVQSGAHERLLRAKGSPLIFEAVACPKLVPLVERGLADSAEARAAAREYLHGTKADTVVLGCTHYPLMEQAIKAALPEGVAVVNPAGRAARLLQKALAEGGLLNSGKAPGSRHVYLSGSLQDSMEIIRAALPDEQIQLEQYAL